MAWKAVKLKVSPISGEKEEEGNRNILVICNRPAYNPGVLLLPIRENPRAFHEGAYGLS